jgi:hypothetical protein
MARYSNATPALDAYIKKLGYIPAYGQPNVYRDNSGNVIFANGKFYRTAQTYKWEKFNL